MRNDCLHFFLLFLSLVFICGCPAIDSQVIIESSKNIGSCGKYKYEIPYIPIQSQSCIFPIIAWNDFAHESELTIELAIEGEQPETFLTLSSLILFLDDNSSHPIKPYKYEQSNFKFDSYTDGLYYEYKQIDPQSKIEYYKFYFEIPRESIEKFILEIASPDQVCPVVKTAFKKDNKLRFRVWGGH